MDWPNLISFSGCCVMFQPGIPRPCCHNVGSVEAPCLWRFWIDPQDDWCYWNLEKLQGLCISKSLNARGDVTSSAGKRPDVLPCLPEACSARLDMVALASTAVWKTARWARPQMCSVTANTHSTHLTPPWLYWVIEANSCLNGRHESWQTLGIMSCWLLKPWFGRNIVLRYL